MLMRLIRVYQRVKGAFLVTSALILESKHKYHEALKKIKKAEEHFPFPAKIKLKKGLLYYSIGKHYDSLECLTDAYNSLKESTNYREMDKQYLMCYTSVKGLDVAKTLGYAHQRPFEINYEAIDLKKVRNRLKRVYPLPGHPCWGHDDGANKAARAAVVDLENLLPLADQGDVKAQRSLAERYRKGDGVPQDDRESAKWYRRAAEQGCIEAQSYLGVMYEGGRGIRQNHVRAVKWFERAAEQGDCFAQYDLGIMYERGRGVQQSDKEAAKWFRSSAEQGHADAQFNLGVLFTEGRGVPQDDVEAVKSFSPAAEQGHASAQYNLGIMYQEGRGLPRDDAEAAKWYLRAAEQGHHASQNRLGWKYREGRGVPADSEEALKWFRRAAEQGFASAQFALCGMYWQGDDVSKDSAQAYFWCKLAAASGEAEAQKLLSLLTELMTAEEIAEAERRIAEWKPGAGESSIDPKN